MGSAVVVDTAPARRRRSKRTNAPLEVVLQDRAYDAHQLRLAGLDWLEIAQRVGYLEARIACMAVTAFLQKVATEQSHDRRNRALDLELARLDQLQSAYHPAAMAGDIAAATFVLKIIARRCAILGLDKVDDGMTGSPRTIVIGGSTDEYIAGLKSVVEDRTALAELP